jgi:CHRD domain
MRVRHLRLLVAIGAVVVSTAAASTALAGDENSQGDSVLQVRLNGFDENPLALSTTGSGSFSMRVDTHAREITYELSYADLEAPITQAHIHFGSVSQVGGISVFLCTNLGNGPAGTQACPAAPATITGTLTPANIIGPAGQGIEAGAFDELVDAIRAGKTYVNVHSTKYPIGEIRAQLEHGHH